MSCVEAEKPAQKAPETVEVVVCGDTQVHGGKYEWSCFLEPHNDNRHAYRAFKVA